MIDSIKKALAIVKEDKSQENHLFQKLAETSNPAPWLEPLFKKRFFSPQNNPSPEEVPFQKGSYRIPRWNVLGYLENVASYNYRNPEDKITNLLLKIIDAISSYRTTRGRVDNYSTDWTLFKVIFSLPKDKITESHIEFIDTVLKTEWTNVLIASEIGNIAIPRLINDNRKELMLRLLCVTLQYRIGNDEEYISILDNFWLKEALSKNKMRIASFCGSEAADIGISKMAAIIRANKYSFSNTWIPAIGDTEEVLLRDRYEYQLVDFVRDMLIFSDVNSVSELISHLLVSQAHPIFRRIAIYSINRHFSDLKHIFWQWNTQNPLDDIALRDELYELIHTNCISFSVDEIATVLRWIETKKYEIYGKSKKKETTKLIAIRKKWWLSALLDTRDSDVAASYKKYDEIAPGEVKFPDHIKAMWKKVPEAQSIDYHNDILGKQNNHEIVSYLNNFEQIGDAWEAFTQDDLFITFRDCVKENPERFSMDLEPFLLALPLYQDALLWGFREAWENNKSIIWEKILNFIVLLLKSTSFWKEKTIAGNNYTNRIIEQIAELIKEGTKDDRHAFNEELLPLSENILLTLALKTKSDLNDMNDLVTSVLNSTQGKIFDAMLSYSFRNSHLTKNKSAIKWADRIKEHFSQRLSGDLERTIEFSLTLGKYLANIYYHLDKKWIEDNLRYIFPMGNDKQWQAVMTGYLFYTRSLFVELYPLLRNAGHYEKAFETCFPDHKINERLIEHICVAYLSDLESLDDSDSLIAKLVNNGDLKQISNLINFLWMLRGQLKPKHKEKIKPIWRVLYTRLFSNIDHLECQKEISDLIRWLSLVNLIDDEIFRWLSESIKYVEVNYNTPHLVEYLLDHVKTTPERVGKLYLAMINSNIYPTFNREHIRQIVELLYDYHQEAIADSICNAYLGIGDTFLVDIYNKHLKKLD